MIISSKPSKFFSLKRNAFPEEYLSELKECIFSCPYLDNSPPYEELIQIKGFSVVFRRTALKRVGTHFPYLIPYIETALLDKCNAFYINALMLYGSSYVGYHIDCRLFRSGSVRVIPNLVSVLYVHISEDLEGGELVLKIDENKSFSLKPERNTLLYFKGNLSHSINRIKSSEPRLSLVCEQYNLDDEIIQEFPEYQVVRGWKKY